MWHLFSHIKRKDWKVALKKTQQNWKELLIPLSLSLADQTCYTGPIQASSAFRDLLAEIHLPDPGRVLSLSHSSRSLSCRECVLVTFSADAVCLGSQARRGVAHGGHAGQEVLGRHCPASSHWTLQQKGSSGLCTSTMYICSVQVICSWF